jgi:predicted phosphodiesterase
LAGLKKENDQLRKMLDRLTEDLEQQRKAKFKIPKGKATASKGSFVRLVVPDTHGSLIDKKAARAMLEDAKRFDVREVVLLGDHVDCSGFLAGHHTLGFVAEWEYSYTEDVTAANVFLDELQAACPKAKVWYIEGNHEVRVDRYCVNQKHRKGVDAAMMMKALAPRYLLHLKERGVEYVSTLDQQYNTGETRNCLELGKCLFMHGYSHAKHATEKTLSDLGKNVVVGHIHRRQSFSRSLHDSEISAWCPGCLCEKRKYYMHARPTHHAHGYGLQAVQTNGEFLHVNVPIIDGKSYLSSLGGL